MLNINFVPDDYVQNSESRKTNLIYLVLFVSVMLIMSGIFVVIKFRQKSIAAKEQIINQKMSKVEQAVQKFDQLQKRRLALMKTAIVTAELPDPVPTSVLLASLTNSLPRGVTFIDLRIDQQELKQQRRPASSKYDKKKKENEEEKQEDKLPEPVPIETSISIEGVAPSDLQVASYIERLNSSMLLKNVELQQSKERKVKDMAYRQFKLTAKLDTSVHLSKEDVKEIREAYRKRTVKSF